MTLPPSKHCHLLQELLVAGIDGLLAEAPLVKPPSSCAPGPSPQGPWQLGTACLRPPPPCCYTIGGIWKAPKTKNEVESCRTGRCTLNKQKQKIPRKNSRAKYITCCACSPSYTVIFLKDHKKGENMRLLFFSRDN